MITYCIRNKLIMLAARTMNRAAVIENAFRNALSEIAP